MQTKHLPPPKAPEVRADLASIRADMARRREARLPERGAKVSA